MNSRVVVQVGNEEIFLVELRTDLRGPELSDAIRRAVLQQAGDAGAVSIGDMFVTGSILLDEDTIQHSVRVRLFFGGPHARRRR